MRPSHTQRGLGALLTTDLVAVHKVRSQPSIPLPRCGFHRRDADEPVKAAVGRMWSPI